MFPRKWFTIRCRSWGLEIFPWENCAPFQCIVTLTRWYMSCTLTSLFGCKWGMDVNKRGYDAIDLISYKVQDSLPRNSYATVIPQYKLLRTNIWQHTFWIGIINLQSFLNMKFPRIDRYENCEYILSVVMQDKTISLLVDGQIYSW